MLAACATAPGPAGRTSSSEAELLLSASFETLTGEPTELSDLRGQVVLVDFFATWCLPCADSLPVYERFHRELGPRGFVVVAVSEDEVRDAVPAFMQRYAPNVRVVFDPQGRVADRLALPGMPTAFLLDRAGQLLLRHEGFRPGDESELEAVIQRALGPD